MKINIISIVFLLLISLSAMSAQGIIITSPSNNTNFSKAIVDINYTLSNVDYSLYNYSCWYNYSGDIEDIDCDYNTTFVTGIEGNNSIAFFVNISNSTFSYINSSSVSFIIDSIKPIIDVIYPENGKYYNKNVTYINYTVDELHRGSCWFFNGTRNNTAICGQNAVSFLFSKQGINDWIVYVNDTFGNLESHIFSFTLDTIKPMLESIKVYTTSTSAKIYYYSNETVNYTIIYGIGNQNNLTMNRSDESYDDSTYTQLNSLKNGTTYYFNITICDRAFNCNSNGTYSFTTNISDDYSDLYYSCTTSYNCSDWNACASNGYQIRSCYKLNNSCYAPLVSVRQSCAYHPDASINGNETTLLSASSNTQDINSTAEGVMDKIKELSTIWKTILAIIVGGALIWLIVIGVKSFRHRTSPPSDEDLDEELSPEEIEEYLDK
jgi:hypothetical protein